MINQNVVLGQNIFAILKRHLFFFCVCVGFFLHWIKWVALRPDADRVSTGKN